MACTALATEQKLLNQDDIVGGVELADVEGGMSRWLDMDVAFCADLLTPGCVGAAVQYHTELVTQANGEKGRAVSIIEHQDHEDTAGFISEPVRYEGTNVDFSGSSNASGRGWSIDPSAFQRLAFVIFMFLSLVS